MPKISPLPKSLILLEDGTDYRYRHGGYVFCSLNANRCSYSLGGNCDSCTRLQQEKVSRHVNRMQPKRFIRQQVVLDRDIEDSLLEMDAEDNPLSDSSTKYLFFEEQEEDLEAELELVNKCLISNDVCTIPGKCNRCSVRKSHLQTKKEIQDKMNGGT